jgi:hypothetical protein
MAIVRRTGRLEHWDQLILYTHEGRKSVCGSTCDKLGGGVEVHRRLNKAEEKEQDEE